MMNIPFSYSDLLRKYMIMALAMAGLLFILHPVKAQTPTQIQDIEQYLDLGKDQNMYLVIRASMQQNSLEKIADKFRERGVNIAFSDVQYNADKLLTRIAMEVTIGNCEPGSDECYRWKEEAYNDGKPLKDNRPLIFYLYQKEEKAGVSYGYPDDLPSQEIKAMKHITGSLIGTFRAN